MRDVGKKGRDRADGVRVGVVTKKRRGVYSEKPISSNAKPSSDAPQTKQTKHLIRLIVRDIPQLNVCADEGTLCGQLQLTQHRVLNLTQVRYSKSYHQSSCIITNGCTIILFK